MRNKKNYANIGMAALAELLSIKTPAPRRAVAEDSAFCPEGTHFLQAPLRLYLLLHFYADSNDGLVMDADPEKLARELNIHAKTLKAALRKLEAGGFVSVAEDPETGIMNIRIERLLDMYKRRGEGGKGYVTVSSEQLRMLIGTKSTNELRLTLTTLMRSTTAYLNSASKQGDTAITFKTVRKGLPQYLKPCILRSFLSEGIFPKLFDFSADKWRRFIRVRLKPEYDAAELKAKRNEESRRRISSELSRIVNKIESINSDIAGSEWLSGVKWLSLLKDHNIDILRHGELSIGTCTKQVRLFRFSSQNIRDAVRIAQDYDDDIVIRAIQRLYDTYLTVHNGIAENGDIRGRDIGGLLRRIVEEILSGGMTQPASPLLIET